VSDVASRLAEVRERVDVAARRAGRFPDAVTIVGATKTVSVERIAEALVAGLVDIGENRAQELVAKAPELEQSGITHRWHFLGRLQRNKVRMLAPWVQCWQSVDRTDLVDTIADRAPGATVLLEVNLGDEPGKGGCRARDLPAFVDHARHRGLHPSGLMTVPPAALDPRPFFARLRELADTLGLAELSMGMTGDFEAAIEEGATIVRVGRAIFGDRPAPVP